MKIVGLDMSVTHTGAVKMTLDQNLEIVSIDWLTFVTTKKYSSDNAIWYDEDSFTDKYDKYSFMQERILAFCEDAELVSAEDYAFGAKSTSGLIFDLAEFEGWIRQSIWRSGKPLYLYSPGTLKKLLTTHGNSDKLGMYRSYKSLQMPKPDLSSLPIVTNGKKGAKGTSDVIDAYAAALTLLYELIIERDGSASAFPSHIQEIWKNRTRTVICRSRRETDVG